ncbi:MAG: PEP-CTERM sorting domain-containing protein [Microcystaceae cyanobacterium]
MKNIKSLSSLGLTALGGLFLGFISPSSVLAGDLYFSSDPTPGDITPEESALYTLNPSTGAATLVGNSGVGSATVGLSPGRNDSLLYGSQKTGLLDVNIDGSGTTSPLGTTAIEGLAYDFVNEVLYGAGEGNGLPGSPQFFTIDTINGSISTLPSLPIPVFGFVDIEGLAYGNGVIYALEQRDDARLFSFNLSDSMWSEIGTTGVQFRNAGLAYDSDLDLLYGITDPGPDQSSVLYSINVTTGEAMNIGNTGVAGGGGLAFVASEPTTPPTPSVPEPSAMLGLMIIGGFGFLSGLKKDG